MSRIQRLSPNLINKIAAGEVIERPGSVVKELMENSIDAGSTRIDVVIEKGGSELIRIVDNGCGMDADDLILAVTSHATSKLQKEEDLFSVSTMGFRGEAMASVAEISQMSVRSRVNPGVKPKVGDASKTNSQDEISGMELRVEGGSYQDPAPCGCPPGTQIDVKNLFFNTPVRRKFLKSVQTEFGYISEFFIRLALANPAIHFTLKHNGRSVYDLPATEDWLQRICDVEGKDLADALISVDKTFDGVRLHGFVARPNHSRSNPKMQFLFLNGRPIRDRSLQHALLEAYRGLLTQNRFPICFLKLEMPPEMVDVNVHPTKMEVRFQDSNHVYGQFLTTLRSKFLSTNMATFVGGSAETDALPSLTETFRNMDAPEISEDRNAKFKQSDSSLGGMGTMNRFPWEDETSGKSEAGGTSEGAVPPFRPFEDASSGSAFSARRVSSSGGGSRAGGAMFGGSDSFGVRPRHSIFGDEKQNTGMNSERDCSEKSKTANFLEGFSDSFDGTNYDVPVASEVPVASDVQVTSNVPVTPDASSQPLFPETAKDAACGSGGFESPLSQPKIMQIHHRYIVTECPEGLMVIDQHAMHERILYERLKNRMQSMSVEVQRLLVPEAVDLRPSEYSMLMEKREQLEEMGIQLEAFGGSTVLVHAVPTMLFIFEKKDRVRVDELIYEILEVINSGGGELTLEKFVDDTLHTIACKAACKAGQPLSLEEMRKLLDEYSACPVADHCPHGRPSVLIWSCTELDKLFCRIL